MAHQALTTSEPTKGARESAPAQTRSLAAYRIKRFREVNKLSAAELAAQLGVSQPTVFYWETGQKVPRTAMQGKLHERRICSPMDWHLPAPADDGQQSAA